MSLTLSVRKVLAALLAFAAFSVVLVAGGAATQQQQALALGGNITVTGSYSILVTYNWGDIGSSTRLIYPGQRSNNYGNGDTDGFYSPSGRLVKCRISPTAIRTYSSGWHKIDDLTNLTCWR